VPLLEVLERPLGRRLLHASYDSRTGMWSSAIRRCGSWHLRRDNLLDTSLSSDVRSTVKRHDGNAFVDFHTTGGSAGPHHSDSSGEGGRNLNGIISSI